MATDLDIANAAIKQLEREGRDLRDYARRLLNQLEALRSRATAAGLDVDPLPEAPTASTEA